MQDGDYPGQQLRKYRRSLDLQDRPVCADDEEWSEGVQRCVPATTLPCTITGCGRFATCPTPLDGELSYCVCTSSDVTEAPDWATADMPYCVPSLASRDEQRIFWTLSMFLFGIGFVLCLILLNEFARNGQLMDRGGPMWGFAAVAVPCCALSGVSWIFHFINLINGQEMANEPCQFFAIVTTMTVYATFFGPPIVGLVTLLSFYNKAKGVQKRVPRLHVAATLALPWLVGMVIAIVAHGENKTGSYRGLFCYNKEWDSFATGGILITFFCLCAAVTLSCYVAVAFVVFRVLHRSGSSSDKAGSAFKVVLKRGVFLVATFFATWALFIVAVSMNMAGTTPSLTFEMVAALFISAQVSSTAGRPWVSPPPPHTHTHTHHHHVRARPPAPADLG